jgi:hypothetical protein
MEHQLRKRSYRTRPVFIVTAILLLTSGLAALPAHADDHTLWPRLTISIGDFITANDSKVRVDASSEQLGSTIDFDADLGLGGSENVFTARIDLLLGRRHELSLGYFDAHREGRQEISEEIAFGGIIFPVNAEVEAGLRQTQTELAYTWWMLRRDRAGFGATLGVVDVKLEADLLARVEVAGFEEELQAEASTRAPVPLVGLRGRGLLGRWFVLAGELRFLPNVEIGDYSGDAYSASAGLEWRALRNFGLGVSYDVFGINVDLNDKDWRGSVDYSTSGIHIVGRLVF